jgi:hypothetical protein
LPSLGADDDGAAGVDREGIDDGTGGWARTRIEGQRAPVDQRVDGECKLSMAERERLFLPARFVIYSYDCLDHRPVEADCRAVDGVWASTELRPV